MSDGSNSEHSDSAASVASFKALSSIDRSQDVASQQAFMWGDPVYMVIHLQGLRVHRAVITKLETAVCSLTKVKV